MAFDARAWLASHEPWSFTDGRGRRWKPTRELSALEVVRWSERYSQARTGEAWLSVTSRLVRRLFPFRFRYWWSGDPCAAFKRLPLEMQQAALTDLFQRGSRTTTTPAPANRSQQMPSSSDSRASSSAIRTGTPDAASGSTP